MLKTILSISGKPGLLLNQSMLKRNVSLLMVMKKLSLWQI